MSFLGFLGKTIIGGVTGFVTGGPAGAVIGGVTSALGGRAAGSSTGGVTPSSPLPATRLPTTVLGGGFRVPTLTGGLSRFSPGGAIPGTGTTSLPGSAAGGGAGGAGGAGIGSCSKGYHIKKRQGAHIFNDCVKNRHMNVANPKALRRALRRAYGFEKMAMRTIRLLHPGKHKRFGGFKRARSRSR